MSEALIYVGLGVVVIAVGALCYGCVKGQPEDPYMQIARQNGYTGPSLGRSVNAGLGISDFPLPSAKRAVVATATATAAAAQQQPPPATVYTVNVV